MHSSNHLSTLENTLIILIQKLLCAPVFAQDDNISTSDGRMRCLESQYHIRALGVMIAAHLLSRSCNPLPITDVCALVSSVSNSIASHRHKTIVYVLDALCIAHDHVSQRYLHNIVFLEF